MVFVAVVIVEVVAVVVVVELVGELEAALLVYGLLSSVSNGEQ